MNTSENNVLNSIEQNVSTKKHKRDGKFSFFKEFQNVIKERLDLFLKKEIKHIDNFKEDTYGKISTYKVDLGLLKRLIWKCSSDLQESLIFYTNNDHENAIRFINKAIAYEIFICILGYRRIFELWFYGIFISNLESQNGPHLESTAYSKIKEEEDSKFGNKCYLFRSVLRIPSSCNRSVGYSLFSEKYSLYDLESDQYIEEIRDLPIYLSPNFLEYVVYLNDEKKRKRYMDAFVHHDDVHAYTNESFSYKLLFKGKNIVRDAIIKAQNDRGSIEKELKNSLGILESLFLAGHFDCVDIIVRDLHYLFGMLSYTAGYSKAEYVKTAEQHFRKFLIHAYGTHLRLCEKETYDLLSKEDKKRIKKEYKMFNFRLP